MDIVSDLHLESNLRGIVDNRRKVIDFLKDNRADLLGGDLLIIAGDVSTCVLDIKIVLEYYASIYKNIVYVLGNSEYKFNLGKSGMFFDRLGNKLEWIRELVRSIGGVYLLEGESVEIRGKVYYGCIGGVDPLYVEKVKGVVSEEYFKNTVDKWREKTGLLWKGVDFNNFYKERSKELAGILNENIDVVVTHYVPYYKTGMFMEYKENLYIDIGNYTEFKGTWVCGHVHKSRDEYMNGVRYVSRPLGRVY